MQRLGREVGIKVEEPSWIEVQSNLTNDFTTAIRSDMDRENTKIALVIIPFYKDDQFKKTSVKSFLDKGGIIS